MSARGTRSVSPRQWVVRAAEKALERCGACAVSWDPAGEQEGGGWTRVYPLGAPGAGAWRRPLRGAGLASVCIQHSRKAHPRRSCTYQRSAMSSPGGQAAIPWIVKGPLGPQRSENALSGSESSFVAAVCRPFGRRCGDRAGRGGPTAALLRICHGPCPWSWSMWLACRAGHSPVTVSSQAVLSRAKDTLVLMDDRRELTRLRANATASARQTMGKTGEERSGSRDVPTRTSDRGLSRRFTSPRFVIFPPGPFALRQQPSLR